MKILIVDDSKIMRALVIRTLDQAGFTGHHILEAADGLQALDIINLDPPDLVLSDWNMPVMTGIQLLEEINKLTGAGKITKKIPFVFITSESTDSLINTAKYNGALTLISKPFNMNDFTAKLADVIK